MKIVSIEALAVTVTLGLTDCIALAHAVGDLADSADGGSDRELLESLGAALLSGGFAAFLLSSHDAPHTMRHMWEMWAPFCTEGVPIQRLPVPPEYAD